MSIRTIWTPTRLAFNHLRKLNQKGIFVILKICSIRLIVQNTILTYAKIFSMRNSSTIDINQTKKT